MAVLWSKRVGSTLYEVRTAGNTRRLYSNGIFHTQYNPRHPVTGNVWDLLLLPAFLAPPGMVQRVLVLGVGGGAVIQQLRHFLQPACIVGVELNPVHLQVARRFFAVKGAGVKLYQQEARRWLEAYQGPRFDLIIEDLFGEQEGEPVRAVEADTDWMQLLDRHLAPQGILVMNFPALRELKACALFQLPSLARRYPAIFHLASPQNENAVGVFARQDVSTGLLRQRLHGIPALDTRRSACRLRYRMQRL